MQVSVRNMAGDTVSQFDLPEAIFGLEPNIAVMHQAVLRQLANARLGTVDTKTRAEVSGGGRKPWRQKHTGRARQGSTSAPHWKGGGVAFGPHQRSYEVRMPRKMRRLALRSALSAKAAEKQIVLLDELALESAKTRDFQSILGNLNVQTSALVILPEHNDNVEQSARNLTDVKALQATCLNVFDILKFDTLIMPVKALDVIQQILG